ncbi:hypothetical protein B0H19DRAFT_1274878 [Mycena capillaripes]|nr:hypothetical protein B0H19DRAFT_1274878 [Mycena capillaripes]
MIPIHSLVIKKHNDNAASSSGAQVAWGEDGILWGGCGGGRVWERGRDEHERELRVADPADSFLNGAKPNSGTPTLKESWKWGTDETYGVNLGRWFVLEPFIFPALFQACPSAADEWTLTALMRADGSLQANDGDAL